MFVAILLVTGASFESILKNSTRLVKSEESNIEGLVGLELLRHDLEQAGFGLAWGVAGSAPPYEETTSAPGRLFNCSSGSVPRAVSAGNDLSSGSNPAVPEKQLVQGSDYLAIRGTTVGLSRASRRWTYVTDPAGGNTPRTWPSGNIGEGEGTIILRRRFTGGVYRNDLVTYVKGGKVGFAFPFSKKGTAFPEEGFDRSDTLFIYGVDDEGDLRMPFNRADYYLKRTETTPASCAPHTGTLLKGVVGHAGGTVFGIPLLDCVADMQVVFGWDLNADGIAEAFANADGSVASGGDAALVQAALHDPALLRERLKLIKVYLLAQDGTSDRSYIAERQKYRVGDEGEESLTRTVDLPQAVGPGWRHYRWKLYRMVVHPKNLSGRWH